MKRKFPVFLLLILISGAFLFTSCKDKTAIVGNLTITAKTIASAVMSTIPIYLATSKENLDNGVYAMTGYLDVNGICQFRDLKPKYYWYRVEGWSDYGASEVFPGIDESVVIYLNSPSKK